ncbi:MAG: SpoIIE family protein phosphatase [Methanobacterium sp.]|uniref:PP2C family protein-serine/threonine phosphatase n=1 Tax=Methanobacterium sp. TaxID=2164 RepID=UPI003D648FFF|nr:SpoIIE family protein phosphatase [Methanobacterium sp.]
MDVTIDFLLSLLEKMCVFIVIAYLITRTKLFTRILDREFSIKTMVIFISIFGIITIFSIASGIDIFDTEADMAELAPMVAGLVGGPIIGLAVGVIGGISRYLAGGPASLILSISIMLSGLFAGIIYMLNQRKFIGMLGSVVYSLLMGSLTILLVVYYYPDEFNYIIYLGLPLVFSNTLGILIFGFIISNLIKEIETSGERDKYFKELEQKKKELQIARNIQKSFLPKEIPQPKNFDLDAINIPALEVGGDFYDFIPIGKEEMGLVIADVSGKGVPAALFMAFSRTVIRAKTTETQKAIDIIKNANRLITSEAESGMFVTLFYGILNCIERTFTYVNAGHNPPLIFKSKTDRIKILKTEGIAIGALEEVIFEEKKIKLETGDMIIFYTDGVTEALNNEEEQFGDKRLFKLLKENKDLSPSKMVSKIIDEVEEFSGGRTQFDDITLMVLKAT